MTLRAGPSASPAVSAADASAFRRDGVVLLRGVLTEAEIATLARGVERNLAALGPLGMNATEPGQPGAFVEDFRNWDRIAEYEQVIRGSALAAAAGELTGSREVRLFHDHLLVKEAGTLDPSPWHQDQPYYCIDGSQTVSFWIPLDPVARPSTLEFVAGSHADGTWFMPRSFVARRVRRQGLGDGARRRRGLQHAHAPRRRRQPRAPPRLLGPVHRRRRDLGAPPAPHEPAVRRRGGRSHRGRPPRPPAVPGRLGGRSGHAGLLERRVVRGPVGEGQGAPWHAPVLRTLARQRRRAGRRPS
jgi:hypothetical protein